MVKTQQIEEYESTFLKECYQNKLLEYVMNNEVSNIKKLLEYNDIRRYIDVNHQYKDDIMSANVEGIISQYNTIIHIVCKLDNMDILYILVEYFRDEINCNILNSRGNTFIHISIWHNFCEYFLLNNFRTKIDFSIKNIYGNSIINLAEKRNKKLVSSLKTFSKIKEDYERYIFNVCEETNNDNINEEYYNKGEMEEIFNMNEKSFEETKDLQGLEEELEKLINL